MIPGCHLIKTLVQNVKFRNHFES